MGKNLTAVLVVLVVCLATNPAVAATIFSETFDGPSLPATLNYSGHSSIPWSVSGGQLLADSDGTVNAGVTAVTAAGYLPPTGVPAVYSVDVGIPSGASAGAYNVGIRLGDYSAVFHPGYTPIPGAFRISGGYNLTNTDMGFVPKMGEMHHIEVLTNMIGSSLLVDVTVTGLGTDNLPHTFNYSFLDPTPNLNTGTFGVVRSGGGNALSDGLFDNLQVDFLPEPSCAVLLSLAAVGMLLLRRRARGPSRAAV